MSNTYENIKERILNRINTVLSKIEGSFINNTVSPISEELAKAYMNMEDILKLGFIEDTFYDFLDKRVGEFGVYRKQGTTAKGKLTATGREGTYIPNGTILYSNGLEYTVLNDIVLPTDEKVEIEAIEVGYKYNLKENSTFTWLDDIEGLERLVLASDITSGTDIEKDEELLARFKKTVSNPSTSGNIYHYEQWALECEGVGKAKVYPLWNGNGTVKVMIIGSNNKPVNEDLVNTCKEHIESEMPIGCELTVTTPTILEVNINANVDILEGYTIEEVKAEFNVELDKYIKTIDNELIYSKIYGILAKIEGVNDLIELKLNDDVSNISISEDKIINISSVEISEVV